MKLARVIANRALLLSLLLSFALSVERFDVEEYDYEINNDIDYFEEDDVVLEDAQYDYEEVVGEGAPNNIIPFKKYPGVYLVDLEGVLYALDSDNGKILWARKISDKLMRVTDAPTPPEPYGSSGNATSLQGRRGRIRLFVAHVNRPFNEILVTLDGYILIPRVDGKFNVFQHSIDNIINKDTISVDIPGPNSTSFLHWVC